MDLSQLIETRADEAKSVIEKCIGVSGVWASSELESKDLPGYHGLLWTRDFAMTDLQERILKEFLDMLLS